MFDVVVIGGGIVGCATARELSKFRLKTLLVEKASDLSEGSSKSNSGIVHAGHDCEPNTLKARLNVRGNFMYKKLVEELDIPFRLNGTLVLCFSEEQEPELMKLAQKAKENKVPDVKILNRDEILAMEKNLSPNVVKALYAPTGGIISPYEATVAFAENAFENGVEFSLETKVTAITKAEDEKGTFYKISTNKGEFLTKFIVNAAGLFSDEINNMISAQKYEIKPRKGEYMLLDKSVDGLVNKTIFQLPTAAGKGILITPTVHGNLMVGPSSEYIDDKNSKRTTAEILVKVWDTALLSSTFISKSQIITSFTGLRANLTDNDDFIIGEPEDAKGFINTLAINSPGLSAAPAIAEMIAGIITDRLQPQENTDFEGRRAGIKIFRELSIEEQNALIAEEPAYGHIVCRCETVTEAEIRDSIRRPLGARTIDGVKRRTRSGMGRCQGGFCGSKVLEILAEEQGVSVADITKFGGGSKIVLDDGKAGVL